MKIITTVGTSLFTNFMRQEAKDCMKKLEDNEKASNWDISTWYESLLLGNNSNRKKIFLRNAINNYWLKLEQHKKDNKISYTKSDNLNQHCCAEVQTLIAIAKENSNKTLEVHLICTDTQLSKLAAEIIEGIDFSSFGNITVKPSITIQDLQVNDADKFEKKGFFNLINKIKEIKGDDENVVLNISGGYKALIPPLTIVGQLYDIKLMYLYEESEKLIEFGSLPFSFDIEIAETITGCFDQEQLPNIDSNGRLFKLLESKQLIRKKGNGYEKTIIADLVIEYVTNYSSYSKSNLGLYLEYILFYFYSKNTDEYHLPQKEDYKFYYKLSHNNLPIISRIKTTTFKNEVGDIDLILQKKFVQNVNLKEYVVCEIKSLSQAQNNNLWKKILAKTEAFKEKNGFYPKEVLLFTYQLIFTYRDRNGRLNRYQNLRYLENNTQLTTYLTSISNHLKRLNNNINFISKGFYVDLRDRNFNINYTNLLSKGLDDIEWIDLYNSSVNS